MRGRFIITGAMLLMTALPVLAQQAEPTVLAQQPLPILKDAEKEKGIRELIQVTGGENLASKAIDQLLTYYQQQLPQVAPTFWDRLRKKFDTHEFVDLIIPVYDRYYTKEDIQQLLVFYQSPLGQKLIAVAPQLNQDSMQVGLKWGRAKGEEVNRELKEELARSAPAKKPAPSKGNNQPSQKPG